jgi:hypothetical protein
MKCACAKVLLVSSRSFLIFSIQIQNKSNKNILLDRVMNALSNRIEIINFGSLVEIQQIEENEQK